LHGGFVAIPEKTLIRSISEIKIVKDNKFIRSISKIVKNNKFIRSISDIQKDKFVIRSISDIVKDNCTKIK
jgi:hypothetical protein